MLSTSANFCSASRGNQSDWLCMYIMVQGLEMRLLLTDFKVAVILVGGVISRDVGLLKIAVVRVQTIYRCFVVCVWGGRGGAEEEHCRSQFRTQVPVVATQQTHQVLVS